MFYLFSSDATRRYKTDILDALCYPENHIFRFRYQEQYVSDEIKQWQKAKAELKTVRTKRIDREERRLKEQATLLDGTKTGIIVYAETSGSELDRHVSFYPVRQVEIERVFVEGSVYYVDFRLGQFVNYGRGDEAETRKKEYHDKLKQIPMRPLPYVPKEAQGKVWHIERKEIVNSQDYNRKETTSGYFFSYFDDDVSAQSLTKESGSQAWESVADVLSRSQSMDSSIFFLVPGFYKIVKTFRLKRISRFRVVRKRREKLIRSFDDDWSTKYPIPMGKSVVLKLLFFRSEDAPDIFPQELAINTDTDVLAGISQTQVLVHSHYNEERVELAFKRIFDSILSSISIEHKPGESASSKNQGILAPHPFFLLKVTVPRYLLILILIGLVAAPFLFTLSPDYLTHVGKGQIFQTYIKSAGDYIARNAGDLSTYSKVVAAFITLGAGYFGFRRLPIGK